MRLILGDNPFFGVNHKSGSKPLDDELVRFKNAATIISEAAVNDFSVFMLSAHPGYGRLLAEADDALSAVGSSVDLALVIPYPHSLNKLVAEGGYYALAQAVGYKALLYSIFEFISVIRSDKSKGLVTPFKKLIQIEAESIETSNVRLKYVCLHNVVTDVLLAVGRTDLLNGFAIACIESGFEPVFISQNPISLLSCEVLRPYVACFTYNLLGYMVNPQIGSVDKYLDAISNRKGEKWAMQVFASGALGLEEAIDSKVVKYFDGIVYATTNRGRIAQFSNKIKDVTK